MISTNVLLLMLMALSSLKAASSEDVQDRLRDHLFSSYNKKHLPTHTETNNISIGLSVMNIMELNMFKGSINLVAWVKMVWTDSRLKWNPQEYGNMSIFRTEAGDIWTPDITLYNSHDSLQNPDHVNALLYNTGIVYYLPPMLISAACTVNIVDYPYDIQTCSLKWGSWAHDNLHISLQLLSTSVDLNDYQASAVWDIVDTSGKRTVTSYPCCVDEYEDVTFTIILRRRETHGRIASAVVVVWLVLVVFAIAPSAAGERVVFAGFLVVSLAVLVASLTSEVPMASSTKLGRFLLAGLLLTALVTVYNGLLYRFHPKELRGELQVKTKPLVIFIIDIVALACVVLVLATVTGGLFSGSVYHVGGGSM